ncbi:MAG: transketolase [Ignavibacteriaceae bacterium]|jgi:transketolase (EC 2.2.1.1)|nr:MAG: transketolase [Chlorobi bacterium OLB4]MBW7854760.1 transketolase [Ignavibacteria bacterium]MEB2329929.1 transketolase [Ignavibacteriaceae bacterium]OQY78343.1 MAG: transketolase [Ignavibacteriales bacterium UTCHB1]
MTNITKAAIDSIRSLSMDAVQLANSGHPGTPMALAPVTFVLYNKILNYDPTEPEWFNRDRLILSCGHASMLLYSVLHLTGFDISIDDIKNFRQLKSKTPGHPEYRHTPGVDTSTGPLGQGTANSVGMAIARKWFADRFNKPEFDLISYKVITIVSDGDLMEGVSSEAASLAGHLKLNDLIWIYDNNKITIDGKTLLSFSDDIKLRFNSVGWNVLEITDANDTDQIEKILSDAVNQKSKPTLVILNSIIGYGSPNKQDTSAAHGSPLGEEEVKLTKTFYGLDPDKKFFVPSELSQFREQKINEGKEKKISWDKLFDNYRNAYPHEAAELLTIINRELPNDIPECVKIFPDNQKIASTRELNGKVLNTVASHIPWMIGGSADLSESNNVKLTGKGDFSPENYSGRNIHFGIREHAMGAIANGMRLCNLLPFTGTFLVFSDYMKPAIRMAALMKLNVIFIFSHDSIGLGEDGPTHQPVEHLAMLRAIPGLDVFRPADDKEIEAMWNYTLSLRDRPIAIILSRQKIPMINRSKYSSAEGTSKGGYIIADSENPTAIIIGTGSELYLCIDAFEKLKQSGINVRVVSMPCLEEFDRQNEEYRNFVLPPEISNRISVEAGSTLGWNKYTGDKGVSIGLDSFGESAPADELYRYFNITVERIINEVKSLYAQ